MPAPSTRGDARRGRQSSLGLLGTESLRVQSNPSVNPKTWTDKTTGQTPNWGKGPADGRDVFPSARDPENPTGKRAEARPVASQKEKGSTGREAGRGAPQVREPQIARGGAWTSCPAEEPAVSPPGDTPPGKTSCREVAVSQAPRLRCGHCPRKDRFQTGNPRGRHRTLRESGHRAHPTWQETWKRASVQ